MHPGVARVVAQRGLIAAARLAVAAAASAGAGGPPHRRPVASASAAAPAPAAAAAAALSPSPPPSLPPSATLVDEAQRARLAAFLDHLLLTNETMNLTSVRDRDEAWTRHVEDSLALLPVIERWAPPAPALGGGEGVGGGDARGDGALSSSGKENRGAVGKKKAAAGQKKQKKSQAWFEEEQEQEQEEEQQQQEPQQEEQQQQQQQEASRAAAAAAPATTATTPPPLRLIDVGTGPGLPGMILAIARPHWRVTLLDSLRKRCDFMRGSAELLGLRNVQVVWSRAEDAGRRPGLRDAHDVAVARAVAESRVLAELCLPFVRPGGVWVAAKGAAIEAEVEAAAKAISALRGRLAAVEPVESFYGAAAGAAVVMAAGAAAGGGGGVTGPGGARGGKDGQGVEAAAAEAAAAAAAEAAAAAAAAVRRTAIVVEKVGATPAAYPRPPGTPNKKPL